MKRLVHTPEGERYIYLPYWIIVKEAERGDMKCKRYVAKMKLKREKDLEKKIDHIIEFLDLKGD